MANSSGFLVSNIRKDGGEAPDIFGSLLESLNRINHDGGLDLFVVDECMMVELMDDGGERKRGSAAKRCLEVGGGGAARPRQESSLRAPGAFPAKPNAKEQGGSVIG